MANYRFTVSATKVGIKNQPFEYDFGDNIEDAIQKFGAETVFKIFRQQAVVRAQALCRNHLNAGKTPEEVQAKLNEWKPDAPQRTSKDPIAVITAKFKNLSEEEKKAVLEQIQADL